MTRPNTPKTRFDLVSPGIGRISGGLATFILGGVVWGVGTLGDWPMLRQMGLTSLVMGALLMSLGGFQVWRGSQARTRRIMCPHCKEENRVLADVTQFTCFNCERPLRAAPPARARQG